MRLVTRSDFDGLACGTLLLEAGVIDSWTFAHPKDLQDGLVPVTENDVLANVPFVEGCGLWFDHHSSEHERQALEGKYKGESRITPSCARIIYEYYGGEERFSHFDEMMVAVDKVDSGNLTADEVLNPTGWILVGFLMDPRTGLGRWRNFTIPNYKLMEELMQACRTMNTEEILNLPDVKERIEVYFEQAEKFKEMVKAHTRIEKDVIISGGENIYPVQIEDFLHEFEPVDDVAVIGLPDKRLGEISAAIIKLKKGVEISEEDVEKFCQALPKYKRPRKIIFADVPRNATGKIEKPLLRKIYGADHLVDAQNKS